jgi:hypothetical protein
MPRNQTITIIYITQERNKQSAFTSLRSPTVQLFDTLHLSSYRTKDAAPPAILKISSRYLIYLVTVVSKCLEIRIQIFYNHTGEKN